MDLNPLDRPPAIILVDPTPGFTALQNDEILHRFRLTLDIRRVKTKNKKKAISELEEELLR